MIVEYLNKFRGILFGYKIKSFLYHENLVYTVTLSGSQIVINWQLVFKAFGSNIHHIAVVDNIVGSKLIRWTYESVDKIKPRKIRSQCWMNKLFTTSVIKKMNIFSQYIS